MTATRRQVLIGAASVASAALAPSAVSSAVPTAAPALVAYVLPEVSGDNSGITWASNKQAAWLDIANEHIMLADDCPKRVDAASVCEIEDCECHEFPSMSDLYREKHFDGYRNTNDIKPSAWHKAGFGQRCHSCNEQHAYQWDETTDPYDYCVIDEVVICHECMTYGDWVKVDPKYADQLLDEMLFDEYGL